MSNSTSSTPIKTTYLTSVAFQKKISLVGRWIIAIVLMAFAVFPILWIVSAALNPTNSMSTQSLIPPNASFANFKRLFNDPISPFPLWMWNSVKVTTISTIGSVFITALAAYAFSRFRFTGRITMMRALLIIQVFPGLLAIVAVFVLVSQIGDVIPFMGLDSHVSLIFIYLGGAMGLNIWLMKGFFDTIPRDIDESATVDGATHWQIFTLLLLPLLRPILTVIAILTFIGTYSDFILARILLRSTDKYTLMVGLQIFTSGMFSLKWGVFAAGALMGAVPIMIVYLALQDQIVGGLTQGSVKG